MASPTVWASIWARTATRRAIRNLTCDFSRTERNSGPSTTTTVTSWTRARGVTPTGRVRASTCPPQITLTRVPTGGLTRSSPSTPITRWDASPIALSAPKTHTEVITSAQHDYRVTLGGNLDMDNTLTRSHGRITIGFQPNISLTIANTGDAPVAWPKVVANGRDWSTYEALLDDFTRGATNDQEKALFIWQAMRENRYHQMPLYPDAEFHDPIRMFNSYGLQLCDDMGYVGCSLFKHAGLGKPKYDIDPTVYALHGHVQCEAVVDNALQFLDIDQDVLYLDRECETPVSGDAITRDHDLARREVHYGPVFGGWTPARAPRRYSAATTRAASSLNVVTR